MIDYVLSFEFNSLLALGVYWVPMLVCFITYTFEVINEYKVDLRRCEQKYYTPRVTVGLLIWMTALTFIPVLNLFAMVFDCAGSVFRWIGDVFDTPLVRSKYQGEE